MEEIKDLKICECNSYIISLPLAFDESLSYLERQCAILEKLKETIEQVNINTKYISTIDINFTEINEKINELQNNFNQLETKIDNKVTIELNNQYNKVLSLMNDYQAIFEFKLNQEVTRLENKIEEIEIGNIDVYNPTTGKIENINKVLNDIYDAVRYDAITCAEFDALQLTANEYDGKEITAYNFDNNGKSILINA